MNIDLLCENIETLLEHIDDVIVITDLDGIMCYASQRADHVLGWSPEELIGRPGVDVVHPSDKEKYVTTRANILSGKEPDHKWFAIRVQARNGETRHIRLDYYRLYHAGEPAALLAIVRNYNRERWLELSILRIVLRFLSPRQFDVVHVVLLFYHI